MQEPAASGDAELCEQFNKAINTVMGESAAQVACMLSLTVITGLLTNVSASLDRNHLSMNTRYV
jgi:hypothetical protein